MTTLTLESRSWKKEARHKNFCDSTKFDPKKKVGYDFLHRREGAIALSSQSTAQARDHASLAPKPSPHRALL
jgi:hypothetical protein